MDRQSRRFRRLFLFIAHADEFYFAHGGFISYWKVLVIIHSVSIARTAVVAQPSMRRTATEELPHIRHAKPARFKARSTQKEGVGNKKPRARQRTGLLFVTPAQQTRH
jgi:hypothetical protein